MIIGLSSFSVFSGTLLGSLQLPVQSFEWVLCRILQGAASRVLGMEQDNSNNRNGTLRPFPLQKRLNGMLGLFQVQALEDFSGRL
jgi:hypothetical protein